MRKLGSTSAVFFATALAACNNGLSGLDRGTVRVNGLAKPQPLVPAITRNAKQGDAINAGEKQTRQSVVFTIAEDILAQGNEFSLRRRLPEPAQDLATVTKIPPAGERVSAGEITLEHLKDGGANLSFYAGSLLKTQALSYGDNVIKLTILSDSTNVYEVDLQVRFRDFDVAGTALVGAVKVSDNAGDGLSQGWLSVIKQSEVTDARGNEEPQSILRTGFFSIVHP